MLLLTAHGTIPDAVEATQSGAFGFLTKPVDKQQLLEYVERAMKVSGMPKSTDEWSAEIITRSPAMEACLQQARMVANTDTRVLITGESGTGKELLARAIHRASTRKDQPFVAINCSAMAENLLESELFGHEKGAFTGAHRTHKGLFQAAHGGTLLLDEIGDMPMRLQVKLLRVLQEEQVRPVGSTDAIKVNTRVISATHQDLKDLMIKGAFREDLYYRLNVVNIHLPALRDRREDIPLLVEHFLGRSPPKHPGAQGLRARGRRAARREPLARQHSPALQRRAAERGAIADARDLGRAGPQRARRASERVAVVLGGARRVHAQLSFAAAADHGRQRESGGAAREAQSHGFLQAAWDGIS